MDDNFFDKSPAKTTSFYAAIIILSLLSVLSMGVDVTEYNQHKDINIPIDFSYLILGIDFLIILSIIAIYFYRKIGVFAFPLLVFIHFYLHQYYLSTLLYADIFNLFAFVGLGLLAIIPKWNFYK